MKHAAAVLQTMPGFDKLNTTLSLDPDETLRQVGPGQTDVEGNDASGKFVVADAGTVLLFDERSNAYRWANNKTQVNIELAPILTYIDSGHPNVSLHDFM